MDDGLFWWLLVLKNWLRSIDKIVPIIEVKNKWKSQRKRWSQWLTVTILILTNKSSWNSCFWWKRLWSTSLRCEGNLNATKYEHLNKEEEDEETMRMWQERWAVQMRTVFATAVLSDDGGRWGLWCQWLAHMLNACCNVKLKTFFDNIRNTFCVSMCMMERASELGGN